MGFSHQLKKWYITHQRELPWRGISNPYFIWLSEIILQQTRIGQGISYYYRFIDRFPTVQTLALASEDEVLSLWQGLGYYSRARNLHATAKIIQKEYQGTFPSSYAEVRKLKGIGDYTAAAIMSFAFNQPYATVDGNVYRVLSRRFGIDKFIDTADGKAYFTTLADSLIDKEDPVWFNHAMMDFGALQCVPRNPDCNNCPFMADCIAVGTGQVGNLPRKRGKVTVQTRYLYYFDIRVDGDLFLKKRESGDIWEGLYEFPILETEDESNFVDLLDLLNETYLFDAVSNIELVNTYKTKHILTHQKIFAEVFQLNISNFDNVLYQRVSPDRLEEFGMPRLLTRYLESTP